ncbi:peptidylprolyl isomerase [Aliidongia dinghuensis]|uniref:Parvulin-like PPIase n=1 Tax=Aliidongia dinghuensis TaxID=1867774 RepID=A0A8J2Z0M4_9PROT|nr:peptidylprolyl isomerase [Aliidongia dinghuensis]GGF47775.1 peptidylprolyl isomerase [Aliidongia dinghuensis]
MLASLLALASITGARADDNDVIARAGDIEVKAADIRAYLEALDPREQAVIARNPATLSQSVRLLLAQRALLNEALAKKWDQEPAVAAQLQRVREGAIVETYLQSVSKPPEGYPSETEISAAYEANKTAFLVPRQFHVAQIFVAVSEDADKAAQDKARKKLDAIQAKLKQKGADFGAVAQSDSDDAETAKNHGELAWLLETQLRPEIRKAAAGLAKDAVSEPVRLDDGWHLVKLLDTKPAHTRTLSEVHDQLAQQMRAQRALENRRAYMAKLVEQDQPAINELALSKLLPSLAKEPAIR